MLSRAGPPTVCASAPTGDLALVLSQEKAATAGGCPRHSAEATAGPRRGLFLHDALPRRESRDRPGPLHPTQCPLPRPKPPWGRPAADKEWRRRQLACWQLGRVAGDGVQQTFSQPRGEVETRARWEVVGDLSPKNEYFWGRSADDDLVARPLRARVGCVASLLEEEVSLTGRGGRESEKTKRRRIFMTFF